jgi:hypothetical protein
MSILLLATVAIVTVGLAVAILGEWLINRRSQGVPVQADTQPPEVEGAEAREDVWRIDQGIAKFELAAASFRAGDPSTRGSNS